MLPTPLHPQLVYDHCEALAAAGLDEAAAARRALEEELLAGGSAAGPGPCPCRLRAALEGLHPANITAVTCWPQRALAVTGCADGSVLVLGYDGTLSGTLSAGTSGVLCLALSPDSLGGSGGGSIGSGNLIAAGCMDGSVAVLDSESCAMLACAQPHRKYVVAAAWASDGRHLVTGSWDQSFAVHCLQRRTGSAAAEAAEAEAEAAPAVAAAGEEGSWELVEVYREQCTGKVNAAVFLPPLSNHGSEGNGERSGDTGSGGGPSFLVAVQGSNYLRELCIAPGSSAAAGDDSTAAATDIEPAAAAAAAAATVREVCRRNMNVTGDDHVSFSAAHLALAPCGRLLLVSADNGRLVLYERVGEKGRAGAARGGSTVRLRTLRRPAQQGSQQAHSICQKLAALPRATPAECTSPPAAPLPVRAGWTPLRTLIGLPVEQFHQYAAAIDASGHYAIAGGPAAWARKWQGEACSPEQLARPSLPAQPSTGPRTGPSPPPRPLASPRACSCRRRCPVHLPPGHRPPRGHAGGAPCQERARPVLRRPQQPAPHMQLRPQRQNMGGRGRAGPPGLNT